MSLNSVFEIDNARNEGPSDLASGFVWTKIFQRLTTKKNHIILGARGSGKTALVKMLAHNYLSKSGDGRAEKLIKEKKVIGCYIPMRLEWVGGLINKSWFSPEEVRL